MLRNMLFIAVFALSGHAWAETKDVVVSHAMVTETAPGQTKASVQMEITCVSSIGKLVAVESPLAESVELQRLRPSHGRLEVETLSAVAMRHNHPMSFGPRTTSIMLLGLKQPLKAGDVVPLKLTVNTGGKKVEVEVNAKVMPVEKAAMPHDGAMPAAVGGDAGTVWRHAGTTGRQVSADFA